MKSNAFRSTDDPIAEFDRRLAAVNQAIAAARRRLLPLQFLSGISSAAAREAFGIEDDLERLWLRQADLIAARDEAILEMPDLQMPDWASWPVAAIHPSLNIRAGL